MQISLVRKAQIESQGFTLYEQYDAYSGRTLTYIQHPANNLSDPFAGQSLKFFSSLSEIEHTVVQDGEYFDIDYYSWPTDYAYPGEGYLSQNEAWTESMMNEHGLFEPLEIGLVILAIGLMIAVIVTCISNFIQTINDPCGWGKTIPINDCWKIIVAPDCSKAEFNSCGGPDANGDGVPDGQWAGAAPGESGTPNWTKDIWDPTEMIKWAVIGVVAVVGVYLAITLVSKIGQGKQQQYPQYPPQYYQPPPQQQYQQQQYREAPGIDYVR
jgi:hypothetical protein